MKHIFIKNIKINKIRNISNLDIPLSDVARKHLILTGKNGSGKTTLLLELKLFLDKVFNGKYNIYKSQLDNLKTLESTLPRLSEGSFQYEKSKQTLKTLDKYFKDYSGLELDLNAEEAVVSEIAEGNFLVAYFDAKRVANLAVPSGINKVSFKKSYSPSEKANSAFIQYIVNLKAERSFAKDDNEAMEVERIDRWFENFENRLKEIFDDSELRLKFDRKNFNFNIMLSDKEPFTFTELSDGHSAILSILTELILRMEEVGKGRYDLQGFVLIDEIETHLHVDLQKKILPFLNDFFPNLQFIITTHSPFVLQSISNTVVCDLQKRLVIEDLSAYSYDTLIESYFQADKYSELLKKKIARYDEMSRQLLEDQEDLEEYKQLAKYFVEIPKYHAPELEVILQQIELRNLSRNEDASSL